MGIKKINKNSVRKRKHLSVRKKVSGTSKIPRLIVFKSNKNIYAQLMDDTNNNTITGISSLNADLSTDIDKAKSKVDVAAIVGNAIAAKAKKYNIDKVVFDRSGYLYHGRIKALADGARNGGLKF